MRETDHPSFLTMVRAAPDALTDAAVVRDDVRVRDGGQRETDGDYPR